MMNILFTGGSSFTGSWFIRELAAAGHQVTAIFRNATQRLHGGAASTACGHDRQALPFNRWLLIGR